MTVLDFNAARRAKIERDYDKYRAQVAAEIYHCGDTPGVPAITAVRQILDREMPVLRQYRKQLEALNV